MNGTNLLLTRFNLKSTESKIDCFLCVKVWRFYKNLPFTFLLNMLQIVDSIYMNQWKITPSHFTVFWSFINLSHYVLFLDFRMTKHDIREYLEKIYEVKVLKIRTYTIEGIDIKLYSINKWSKVKQWQPHVLITLNEL